MADLSITSAQVKFVSGAAPARRTAGATVTRGQVVALNPDTGRYGLADASSTNAWQRQFGGISLTDGFDGADFLLAMPGAVINFGAALAGGVVYVVSATAGGIAPVGDLTAGNYISLVAIGAATNDAELITPLVGGAIVVA